MFNVAAQVYFANGAELVQQLPAFANNLFSVNICVTADVTMIGLLVGGTGDVLRPTLISFKRLTPASWRSAVASRFFYVLKRDRLGAVGTIFVALKRLCRQRAIVIAAPPPGMAPFHDAILQSSAYFRSKVAFPQRGGHFEVSRIRYRFAHSSQAKWRQLFNEMKDDYLMLSFERAVGLHNDSDATADAAATLLDETTAKLPSTAIEHLILGEYLLSTGRVTAAVAEILRANGRLFRTPRCYLYGKACLAFDHYNEAYANLRVAAEQADFRRAFYYCGVAAWRAGKGVEAADLFNTALSLSDYACRDVMAFAKKN
jgi:tetratricopeptide (TPR) repeat protein